MLNRTRGRVTSGGIAATSAVLAFSLIVWVAAALAAPPSFDTSFSGDGKVFTNFSPGFEGAAAVARQPDGKLVAVGDGGGSFAVARYNTDGSLDSSFGGGDGKVTTAIAGGSLANDVAIDNSVNPPRIVVAGVALNAVDSHSYNDFAVARYTSAGLPDTSFNGTGWVATEFAPPHNAGDHFIVPEETDVAHAVAVDSAGKVVAAGTADPGFTGEVFDFGVARWNANGTPDNTFSSDGKLAENISSTDEANDVLLYPDGKILVGGRSFSNDAGQNFTLARFNANGTPDTTFSSNNDGEHTFGYGGGTEELFAIALQSDGKIVGVGDATSSSSGDQVNAVTRRFTNGTADTSFNKIGVTLTRTGGSNSDRWHDVGIQPNGRIVAAGYTAANDVDATIGRFLTNGLQDTSWNCKGGGFIPLGDDSAFANGLVIQPDGRVVVAGSWGNDFFLTRQLGGSVTTDCKAPNTSIKGPKKTTKRRVPYRLISTEQGSHFRCRIDGRNTSEPFTDCTSPFRLRLRIGPTRLEVRAIDKAGNADPSPAFLKIKRKPRRR